MPTIAELIGNKYRPDGSAPSKSREYRKEIPSPRISFAEWTLRIHTPDDTIQVIHPLLGEEVILVAPASYAHVLSNDIICRFLPIELGHPVEVDRNLLAKQKAKAGKTWRHGQQRFPKLSETSFKWAYFMAQKRYEDHGRVWFQRLGRNSTLVPKAYTRLTRAGDIVAHSYDGITGLQTLKVNHHSRIAPDGPIYYHLAVAKFIPPLINLAFSTASRIGSVQAIEVETSQPGSQFLRRDNLRPLVNSQPLQQFITNGSGFWKGYIGDQLAVVHKRSLGDIITAYVLLPINAVSTQLTESASRENGPITSQLADKARRMITGLLKN